MILVEKRYRSERGNKAETYQSFTATVEVENGRRYIRVELDNLTRWRSVKEYADYMTWVAKEILTLGTEG